MSVLAIDAGTTGVTALIISADGTVVGRGYEEFRQYYPEPGWFEHLPEGIWQATLAACGQPWAGPARPTLDWAQRSTVQRSLADPVIPLASVA